METEVRLAYNFTVVIQFPLNLAGTTLSLSKGHYSMDLSNEWFLSLYVDDPLPVRDWRPSFAIETESDAQ
jgi:hypothetical protein